MTNDERILNLSATVRSLADLCAKLLKHQLAIAKYIINDIQSVDYFFNKAEVQTNEH